MKINDGLGAKAGRIFDKILDIGAVGTSALIIFIMLSICVEVVLRRMGHPQIWEIEVTEYCLLYVTFLGAAWLLRREGHVKVDIITNAVSPRVQRWLGIITSVIGSAMSLYLVIWGITVTWDYLQRGVVQCTPLLTPTWIVLIIIPLGSIPLFLQFLRRTRGYMGMSISSPDEEKKWQSGE
ncbi:MAG: TRAP transporter small permease [Dehalococcoidia bacterium]|nr:TRAP transporter small permease [Dehalococcoidia bacterium]